MSDTNQSNAAGNYQNGGVTLPSNTISVNWGNEESLKSVTDSGGSSGTAAPSGNNSNLTPPLPDLSTLFQQDYQKNLAMVSNMVNAQGAVIKVNADAVAATSGQTNVLNQNIVNTSNNLIKQGDAARQSANAMKMLGDIGTDAVGGMFEALGKMAGGEKTNPLISLIKTLGAGIKKLGMGLISTGLPILVNPITAAQGALQVGEGGALVAAAGALSTIKMAAGGLVSGSSFVNVGEYAGASHNPEVIAPLDKLRNMMPGGTQQHSFEIQGDKLVSILQRVDTNNSFSLGQ